MEKTNYKAIQTRERLYKEIAKNPGDLTTFRAKAVKSKLVDSGNKFDAAVKDLQASGRVVIKGKNIMINDSQIEFGTFVCSAGKYYVLIDKDNHQYGIDKKDAEGIKSNEKVVIGFSYLRDDNNAIPFIIAKQSENKYTKNDDGIEKEDNESMIDAKENNLAFGRVMKLDHDELVFIPNDKKRFRKNIIILNNKSTLAKFQDKICTMKIVTEEGEGAAMGFIKEIKGEAGNPIAEYDAIAESHGANMGWSDVAVQAELAEIPNEVDLTGKTLTDEDGKVLVKGGEEKLVDLRELSFTTTDPATCKDMDDAIFSRVNPDGTIDVYTAVANVTKYVSLDSEIGKRYLNGAFTFYAPNKAYNILPPELSTNICSLNPNVDRLAFVVKTTIDSEGNPIKSKIMDAVIRSHEKYSYEQAQDICDNNKEINLESIKDKILSGQELAKDEQVILNDKVAKILWKGFNRREIIKFNTCDEYDVKFNQDMSDIEDISPQQHIPYHKVIEAFMLTANEASAKFALDNGIPNIYRVHGDPNDAKLEQASEFFGYLDIPFEGDLSVHAIRKILNSVADTGQEKMVNNFLVRMQSKAKYNINTNPEDANFVSERLKRNNKRKQKEAKDGLKINENDYEEHDEKKISHFGLQSEHYSHTTSPIRRITDYITIYNILAFINKTKMLGEEQAREIAQWANQMQDEIDLAERERQEVNASIYCEHHIGDIMKGNISGFKRAYDLSGSLDTIYVTIENEEKGINVNIPLNEVFKSKGINCRNATISAHGSAIVNKENNKPLLKICSPVNFKITQSDRKTRMVYATADFASELIKEGFIENLALNSVCKPISPKKVNMLKGREYRSTHIEDELKYEEDKEKRGEKFLRSGKKIQGADDLGSSEAFKAHKTKHKCKKNSLKERHAEKEMFEFINNINVFNKENEDE